MSDYITGLRADLVEAAERLERRGRVGRTAWPLHPRVWGPAATRGALAAAACALAVAAALTVFKPSPPQPERLKIVATVRLGGVPADAAVAGGSLWVGDMNGGLTRVDPRSRRVTARIGTGGDVGALAAGAGALWVTRLDPRGNAVLHIDLADGRVVGRTPARFSIGEIEVAGGAIWLDNADRLTLDRLDPASAAITASVPQPRGVARMASSPRALWVLSTNGTLAEIDAVKRGVVHRVAHVVPLAMGGDDSSGPALAADATGAWVSDPRSGTVTRVEGGRVTRRVPVSLGANLLAASGDALWVSYGDGIRNRYGVARVDPRTGRTTATVGIGSVPPKVLVPVGDALWVIRIDGTAVVVSR